MIVVGLLSSVRLIPLKSSLPGPYEKRRSEILKFASGASDSNSSEDISPLSVLLPTAEFSDDTTLF